MVDTLLLEKGAAAFGVRLSKEQIGQFARYAQFLVSYNEKVNLTAITDPEGIAVKHFVDSIAITQFASLPRGARVADVGSGAGFPGVPMKLIRPDISLTLLDSLNKRIVFQQELAGQLGISFNSVHIRAEDAGQDPNYRERFTFVTARAVADLAVLAEYCLPLIYVGGTFAAMKGPACELEIAEAEKAIAAMGGAIRQVVPYVLPDESRRTAVIIEKVAHTPAKYPRKGAAKKPIR